MAVLVPSVATRLAMTTAPDTTTSRDVAVPMSR